MFIVQLKVISSKILILHIYIENLPYTSEMLINIREELTPIRPVIHFLQSCSDLRLWELRMRGRVEKKTQIGDAIQECLPRSTISIKWRVGHLSKSASFMQIYSFRRDEKTVIILKDMTDELVKNRLFLSSNLQINVRKY